MNFGQKLQTARINMNLTQQKIANDFFITRQTVSSWENGNSYPDIMILLVIELLDLFSVIKLGGWLGWTIWGVFVLSVRAFDMLSKFDVSNTMGFKYTWQRKLKTLLHM